MAYTPDDLRTRYPEFEDTTEYPDERVELFIADTAEDIGTDPGHWGSDAKHLRASMALTAHYLVVATNSEYGDFSPLKTVEQKKVGDVSIKHAMGKTAPKSFYTDRLQSTVYGQEFLSLRRRCFVGIIVVPDTQ